MQLRNRYYLSDYAESVGLLKSERSGEKSAQKTGWIKPLWILPRAWCVMTSLQVKGVPRHKTSALVQLQLNRLAPFADCGVYACRSGDWVHLWFWENRLVRDFCAKTGLDFNSLQLAPESVCFPKFKDGAVLYECKEGIEAQLWHQDTLIDTAWWPDLISDQEWIEWRPTSAAATGVRSELLNWPEKMPARVISVEAKPIRDFARLAEPWGRNLLGTQWWHVIKDFRIDILLIATFGLLAGFAAYLSIQWWTLQTLKKITEEKISTLSVRVDPLNDARSKALSQQQWINKLAALRSQDGIQDMLKSLQPVLQQQEAALREFEYLDGELRLTLVPINTELNIASLIQDMESLPKLSNLRLLPDSDVRVVKVSAKMQRLGKPSGELRVLGQLQTPTEPVKADQSPSTYRSGKREKGE
ncbi:hypothetical protein AAKU64_003364 [Undibacterium sp. GrIS 1.8]|uniref:hypothetical protein n=1 Tax=Undibacterium sp. GrIS 1.8 TaxID=3143934 RepID=UPI003392F2DD